MNEAQLQASTYSLYIAASKTVGVVNLIEANTSGTTGLLLLVQSSDSSEVSVRGRISQLSVGSHGFHVHTTGATGNNCGDAGGHFNPTNVSISILSLKKQEFWI